MKTTLICSLLGLAMYGFTLVAVTLASPWLTGAWFWKERSPLPLPRGGYGAAAIGETMLIAGGSYWENGEKKWTAGTDLFDPQKNAWIPGPPLPAPRGGSASVTLNGALYLLGGTVNGAISSGAVRFEHNAWTPLSWRLPQELDLPVAAVIGEEIYVFGGLAKLGDLTSATRKLLRGKPGGDWKTMAEFPGEPRVTAAIAALDGKLYIFGGCVMSAGVVRNLSDAWAFDAASNHWNRLADTPVKRRAWGSAIDGKSILLLGGYTNAFSKEIYRYDVAAGVYSSAGTLPQAIADAKYVAIGGKLYSTGGEPEMKARAAQTIEGAPYETSGHN